MTSWENVPSKRPKSTGAKHTWPKSRPRNADDPVACLKCGLEKVTLRSKGTFQALPDMVTNYRWPHEGTWKKERPACPGMKQGDLFGGARIDPPEPDPWELSPPANPIKPQQTLQEPTRQAELDPGEQDWFYNGGRF